MNDNVVKFPGAAGSRITASPWDIPWKAPWRTRELVEADMDKHIAARRAYAQAVAWEAEAESTGLKAQLEDARKRTAEALKKCKSLTLLAHQHAD